MLNVKYMRRSLSEIDTCCYDLYEQVKKEMVPDVIIGITRGGWMPARLLCDRFAHAGNAYQTEEGAWKIPILHPHLLNIGMKRYGTLKAGETEWYQPLTEETKKSLEGKDVLIVDDVLDAGVTLAEVAKHTNEAKPKRLFIAVIDKKTDPYGATEEDKNKAVKERHEALEIIKRETKDHLYYSNELENNVWVIYPWEAKEGSLEVYKRFGWVDFINTLPIKGDLKEKIVEELNTIEFKKIEDEKAKIEREEK